MFLIRYYFIVLIGNWYSWKFVLHNFCVFISQFYESINKNNDKKIVAFSFSKFITITELEKNAYQPKQIIKL